VDCSGLLSLRDGTRYRIDAGKVTWIRDRNGNRLSFTYGTDPNDLDSLFRVVSITDSLNRQVTIQHKQTDQTYGLVDRTSFKGFGGASRTISIACYGNLSSFFRPTTPPYSTQTLQQLFPELNGAATTYNPVVVSAVYLPDGRSFQFRYNPYGEVEQVVLPTGGAIEYRMADGSGAYPTYADAGNYQIFRRVKERHVYLEVGILSYRQLVFVGIQPRPVCDLRFKHDFSHRKLAGVSEREMNPPRSDLEETFERSPSKLNPRRTRFEHYNLNITPAYSTAPARPERFHHRFFRREPCRVTHEARGSFLAIVDLAFSEHPVAKTLASPREDLFHPRDFNHVDSKGYYHRNERVETPALLQVPRAEAGGTARAPRSNDDLNEFVRKARLCEDRTRFFQQRACVRVARAEVGQQKPLRARFNSDSSRLRRRRVAILLCFYGKLFGVGAFVNQQVHTARKVDRRSARTGVQTVGNGLPRSFRSHHFTGFNDSSIIQLHRRTRLQAPEHRAFGHAQFPRPIEVELAWLWLFFDAIPEREHAMIQRMSTHRVVGRLEDGCHLRERTELPKRKRIFHVKCLEPGQRIEIVANPCRSHKRQLPRSPIESHRRKKAGQSVEMISVQMGDEYRREPARRESGALDLNLRALATIKQKPLALANDGKRAKPALERRLARACSQRNDLHKSVTLTQGSSARHGLAKAQSNSLRLGKRL
jgi:hypothetical protein